MSARADDPFPAIAERDAIGDQAVLFQDIRTTLGVPVVNLIWRHLATIPGGLEFAWSTVRPLYVSGDIARNASALRGLLKVPEPQIVGSLGLTDADTRQVATILSSYERSNAMNLIGLSALLAVLEGLPAQDLPAVEGASEPKISGTMPVPTMLTDMPDDVRARVQRLQAIGGDDAVMPTMYRHLSHWPGMLDHLLVVLEPLERSGQIMPAMDAARAEGMRIGAGLSAQAGQPARNLPQKAQNAVHASVSHFVNGAICKMVVIVAILRKAFPNL